MSLYAHERNGDVDELVALLEGSDSQAVRQRAADLLGGVEDHDSDVSVVETLVRVGQSDESQEVRSAAIDALDRQGTEAIEQFIGSVADVSLDDGPKWTDAETLAELLEADLPEVRMAAANVLGRIGDPRVVQPLCDRLDDDHAKVRARAARACGRIGDPEAGAPLREQIGDPSADVRQEVADAIGRIGGPDAADALERFLDDPNPGVRRTAVVALGRLQGAGRIETLAETLGDDSDRVRRAAAYALLEALSNAPTERSHEIREETVDRLSTDDDGDVVEALVEVLEESSQTHQTRNAAWILGRIASPGEAEEVAEPLVELLAADDQATANIAMTSLAAVDGDHVESTLLSTVDDPEVDPQTTARAVLTLGKVGSERARRRLDALVDDTDHEVVRQRAFSALSRLGGR